MEAKSRLKWKNPLIVWVGLCMGIMSVNAQEIISDTANQEKPIFVVAEEMPEFPGGEEARMKFLIENLNYPITALEQGLSGIAYLHFIVEKDGSLTDIKIVRSSGHTVLDEEAMRIAKLMPNWNPAKQRGKEVRVFYAMPIKFIMEESKNTSKIDKKKKKNRNK